MSINISIITYRPDFKGIETIEKNTIDLGFGFKCENLAKLMIYSKIDKTCPN